MTPSPENRWGPRYLGWGFTSLGIAGVVLGLAISGLGVVVLGLTGDVGSDTKTVLAEVLESTEDGIDTAQSILTAADEGLASVDEGVVEFRAGLADFDSALADMSDVIAVDLADSFDSLRETFPGLIGLADVLDDAIELLEAFGVESNSDTTLGEAFRAMEESLLDVPEQLREQGRLLDEGRADLASVQSSLDQIATSLGLMREEFAAAALLFEDYRAGIGEIEVTVDRAGADIDRWRPVAGWALVAAGILMVLWQAVPLYLGSRVRKG